MSWNQTGPAGPAGVSGWEIITAMSDNNTDPSKSVTAYCPPGKVVVGGGGFPGVAQGIFITNSFAQNSLDGQPGRAWAVYAQAPDVTSSWRLVGQAICVTVN